MFKLAPMKPALKTQTDKARMTSETILHAAESVMIEAGYHNFSIRRVASAAGVTVGNLQYHFPTKDVFAQVFAGSLHWSIFEDVCIYS